MLGPSSATAATVVNGDFEAGSLQGWSVHRTMETGNWFAYKGTSEPIAKERGKKLPQAPPQGLYAAISDQLQDETLILSQDIALEPGMSHRLNLLAYYDSVVPIAVPTPDTLSVAAEQLGGQANQQFRIDVMRAGAPLESLDPADVLLTVFRTQPGDPQSLQPTWLSADLSPFAGQTVRLRVVNAASEELLTAGVDAVSVDSAPRGELPPPPSSNRFEVVGGRGGGGPVVAVVGGNGTAILKVKVPGPGRLTAKGKMIKPATVKAARAGTVRLRLRLIPSALEALRQTHRLRVRVAVTFDPVGGPPRTRRMQILFKLESQS